jgi:5-methylcytosine-specific restriction endonuclease McrA
MPITRKYKTKDGSTKHKTYTTVRGQRAESYRREQNRQYRAKIRQLQPPRQRVYPPSQADTLPSATVHQIIDDLCDLQKHVAAVVPGGSHCAAVDVYGTQTDYLNSAQNLQALCPNCHSVKTQHDLIKYKI